MKKCIDKAAIENILHKLWKKDTGYEHIDIARIAYNRALQDVQIAIDSKQEEPVSEDLEEAANDAVISLVPSFGQKYSDGSYVSCIRDSFKREELIKLYKAGANWQKHKDESYTKSMYKVGINTGKELMEQQMMAKAVDATVHIDAGGYPYIPQMELYDYDKDVPLAKKGDRVKVVVVKED